MTSLILIETNCLDREQNICANLGLPYFTLFSLFVSIYTKIWLCLNYYTYSIDIGNHLYLNSINKNKLL